MQLRRLAQQHSTDAHTDPAKRLTQHGRRKRPRARWPVAFVIPSVLNVVVLTLLDPKPEEKTFYGEFTVSVEQESDSQRIMKTAFTAFEPPVESGASTAELSFPCSHRLKRHFRSIKC